MFIGLGFKIFFAPRAVCVWMRGTAGAETLGAAIWHEIAVTFLAMAHGAVFQIYCELLSIEF
jgi:hypothetical protein